MDRGISGVVALILAAVLLVPESLAGQTGQIIGTVTRADTGEPVSAAQVYVEGLGIGAITGADGTFALTAVPVGTRVVVVERIGFQQVRQPSVEVRAGEVTRVDVRVQTAVLALHEIVVTGLVDPVAGVRSPISVGRVTRQQMPVITPASAVSNLQGRVAGVRINRQSGQPGSGESIMLRSPTSVTLSGAPMVVVDGVILGMGMDPRTSHMGPAGAGEGRAPFTANIESMDIESIEVIRGAAAASLYGSRAAAGVIVITTRRGRELDLNQTQFSARSEYGFSMLARVPRWNQNHAFRVDNRENPSTYVDLDGNPVPRSQRRLQGTASTSFWDTPFPHDGQTFFGSVDNLRNVFRPDAFNQHNLSVLHNTASTNFSVTLNRLHEAGPLVNNDGYKRTAFRLSLDHRFWDNLTFGVTTYHTQDHRDELDTNFTTLFHLPPDVDVSKKDPETGEYLRIPDETIPVVNPLWAQSQLESDRWQARSLANARLRWEPYYWMALSGEVSYDRQDRHQRSYTPKGTPLSPVPGVEADGSLSLRNDLGTVWNAETQISLRRQFGLLNARTTVRGLLERDRFTREDATGSDFFVPGVPRLNVAQNRNSFSYEQEIRSLGYLWDTALDYDAKYIATILLRRDGSSLFGPDNRWHNYYRTAFAWRLGEEDWFRLPTYMDELKVRYARGTAGGRPQFEHQYETWSVGAAGVSKGLLGNTALRPEHTLEQEISLESILFGQRVGVDLTYAWQTTSEQLVLADVPQYTGFTNQWSNGGTLEGRTIELAVDASLIQRPNFSWMSTLVLDHTAGKITEWPFARQNPAWRTWDAGLDIFGTWGFSFLETHRALETHDGGRAAGSSNQFQINDDGYLVWVGEGNTYWEGMSKGLWGTSGVVGGRTYEWGMPILNLDENGGRVRSQIGHMGHLNLGWNNNIRWGGLGIHSQWHAALGFDAVNFNYQVLQLSGTAPENDQGPKPDELKKPIRYYTILAADFGGSSHHVERGNFLKLRTVGVNYRLDRGQLNRLGLGNMGVSAMTIGLVGRNLLTITSYSGFDPEQATDLNLRNNFDLYIYPATRNFALEVGLTF